MTKLLNKYKEIKRTKKGFTLVELLVVIAILAVLASVSVVGYLGFTTKARNSNALTEMTQIREVVRDNLLDGDAHEYAYSGTDNKATFKYSANTTSSTTTYTLTFTLSTSVATNGSSILKGSFTDLSGLNGTFYITTSETNNTITTSSLNDKTFTISTITYKSTANAYAQWNISDGSVKNVDSFTGADFTVTVAQA